MGEKIKKIWKDPVWSKVIATLVIGIGIYFFGLFPKIFGWFRSFWNWINSDTTISIWLLSLLILGSVCFLILIFSLFYYSSKNKVNVSPEPEIIDYDTDTFYGLKWYWNPGKEGEIYNLHSVCLNCLYEINTDKYTTYGLPRFCDNCKKPLDKEISTFTNIHERVTKKIHRKLRTGEWLEVVQSNKNDIKSD